jgi:uncharacterized integral membrane protein
MTQPSDRYHDQQDERSGPPSRSGSGRSPKRAQRNWGPLAIIGAVVIGALIFVVQNHQRVQFSYLSVRINSPLWLAIVGYVALGMIFGAILVYWQRRGA